MNDKFNGERLKQARVYRGMTVAEVAEQVGCQRQTLSMYEIARSQPADKEVVERLSEVLRFPIKYFYEWPDIGSKSTVYFRSLLTTSKKYRSEQITKIDFIAQIYDLLQDYIDFPAYKPMRLAENSTPEDAAYALRDAWGLGTGPIDNLVTVVEQNGILTTTFSTPTNDVDAFSRFVNYGETSTFLIAYSSNKSSAARIHFDVAHELGHICLHEWNEDIESFTKEEFREKERQANEFASAFLLPEESFRADAEAGPQTITFYKQLKKKWKVSIAAMIRRATTLDIMTHDQYQNLIKTMQRRGLRKEEPLDDVLLTASPAMLRTSVMMLLQENVFSAKEFMDELSNEYGLSIEPEEVEFLLHLPEGTLAVPKIIDFQTLQLKKK